jgi:hypothetical protein
VATIKLENLSGVYSRGEDDESPNADENHQDESIVSGETGENNNARRSNEESGRQGTSNDDVLPLARSSPGMYETWMVMEFCEKGSLQAAIRRRKFAGAKNMVRSIVLFVCLPLGEPDPCVTNFIINFLGAARDIGNTN